MWILQVLAAALSLGLVGAGVWFQFDGTVRWVLLLAIALLALWLLVMMVQGRPIWRWLGLVLLLGGVWWATIRPSNGRDWQEEVSRGVTATINGDDITLHDVRRFEWQTPTDYVPAWEDRTYRLSDLQSVDIFTSNWGLPGISHTLIGFGFADGTHVVFSGEIRKEKGEAYSSVAGFFRKYELVLVAADERDIVRVRTDARRETVALWQLQTTPEQRQAMFLSLLDLGNDLAAHPRWYNTLTANCTTVLWRLARATDSRLPLDWRVVMSGHLAGYLRDIGLIGPDQTEATALLAPTDGIAAEGAAYSRALRRMRD